MKTDLKYVEVTYRNDTEKNPSVSVDDICKEFYGILEITFLVNMYSNKNTVYVYTLNLETVDIDELIEIQKRLKADTLSIGYGTKGVYYIIGYSVK
jgi:hypothetical protein